MTRITSTQNPGIKDLLRLEKAAVRKETGLFVIEGYREIMKAAHSGFEIRSLYFCPEIQNEQLKHFTATLRVEEKTEVSGHVFSRIAYRDNHDGLLATARSRYINLDDLRPSAKSLYLVIETVEKPGNLGAILRTADGAGVDGVIVCDNRTDIFNPNVIRASLGCVFTTSVVVTGSEQAIGFFKDHGITIFSAALQDSRSYYEADFRKACAIVLGSEAEGLSPVWREHAGSIIHIPMHGAVDSLNVSVSAAILIFEAVRQRNTA